MKKGKEVIFLIDSEQYDKTLLGLTLEKQTKCRVFNFFCFEETLLYKHLNPKLIVHDKSDLDQKFYSEGVSFFDISKSLDYGQNANSSENALFLASEVSNLMKA